MTGQPDERPIRISVKHLRFGEGWFGREPPTTGIDVRRWRMCPSSAESASDGPVTWVPFASLRTSLHDEPESLLTRFDQTTRYEVRRARDRDELTFMAPTKPHAADVDEFAAVYARTAPTAAALRREALLAYAHADRLRITCAIDARDRVLAAHAYFVGDSIGLLLHSCSGFRHAATPDDRQLHSRANRWLHWRDMCDLQALGIEHYDWGGYYLGSDDEGLERINAFKRSFGGTRSLAFDGQAASTIRGRAYVLLRARATRRAQLEARTAIARCSSASA